MIFFTQRHQRRIVLFYFILFNQLVLCCVYTPILSSHYLCSSLKLIACSDNRASARALDRDHKTSTPLQMRTLYWFRKALRVHDNPSLVKAINNSSNVDPVFCIDPWFVKSGKVGVNRMLFLLESLTDLDKSLRKIGSRLIILYGNPIDEIPRCCEFWGRSRWQNCRVSGSSF